MNQSLFQKVWTRIAVSLVSCAVAGVAIQASGTGAGQMPDVAEIVLPGEYAGHLQDVWWDGGEYLYWAHTWDIVKTDLTGAILCQASVEGHNAGCQVKNGKLYVAVCPTSGKSIVAWNANSRLQVNEYDADTLELLATHVMPPNDRAGSLAVLNDGSFVVGCLRPGDITASQVRFHHVSADFTVLSSHLVDGLTIEMGIETIKRYGDSLYLFCYGAPIVRLDANTFAETGRLSGFDGTRGFIYDGQSCWLGISTQTSGKWHSKLVRRIRTARELAFFEPSATGMGSAASVATYTWTGGAGDGLFSTAGNWLDGVAPTAATANDTLAFMVSGTAMNDIPNLTVGNVDVLLLSGTQLTIEGSKFGGSGTLVKEGDGTLVFNATNMPGVSFSHAMTVNDGILKIPVVGDFYGALTVSNGAAMICSSGNPINFRGPVEILGATTNTGCQLHFYTRVKGNTVAANAGNTTYFHGGLDGIVTLLGGDNQAGQAVFYKETSPCYGYFRTNGEGYIDGRTGEYFQKKSNIFAGAPQNLTQVGGITVNNQVNFGTYSDSISHVVLISNSTINVTEAFSAGRVGPRIAGNHSIARLGAATTVTAAYVLTGYNMWPNYGGIELMDGSVVTATNRVCTGYHLGQDTIPKCYGTTNANEWITVDGGTLNADGIGIGIGFRGPQSRFFLKNGTVNAKGFYFQAFRAKNSSTISGGAIYISGTNTFRFVMTGGTLNLGSWGFESWGREDNSEANVILAGGTLNARENFSIPYYNPTLFGTWRGSSPGGFTLNTAGRTVTLRTALNGLGDVKLTGAGTVVGTNAMQGALGGRWTVDSGMTADLRGAASFLGGLSAGTNANVTLDVGAGRSAAFFSRDGSWPLTAEYAPTNILARFNKSDGGTVSTLISHDMGLLSFRGGTPVNYMGGSRETLLAKGEFYVAPEEAGTWTFSGTYDNHIYIQIDDQKATSANSTAFATVQIALSAGWHRFILVGERTGGNVGPASWSGMAVGYAKSAVSGTAQSDYTPFDPKHIRMRPSSPAGGEASVRWCTVKTKAWADTAWAAPSASNYTNNWNWDIVCLTNSLKSLDRHGSGDPRLNGTVVNRWDGWFLVPFEKAGTWRFRLQYDDRVTLFVDGAKVAATTSYNGFAEADVPLSPGWHRYEVCTFDGSSNSGPGGGTAVSYAVKRAGESDFGEAVKFNEDTLTLSLAPDGYLQGEISLASGARVTNVSDEPALVYGDVSADGATGAVMSGKFACVSNIVDFGTVAADTDDLTEVLRFDNAATNLFADVGRIAVNFTARPTRGTVRVGLAGGLESLSSEALAQRLSVTVGGVPAESVHSKPQPMVENGELRLRFALGSVLIIR